MRRYEEKKKKKMEKKNSRQGISAEVFGQFNKKADYVAKVIPKDPEAYRKVYSLPVFKPR